MAPTELGYWTIRELAAAYRSRQVSPVEVVRHQLERTRRIDPTLHAFLLVQAEEALDAAAQAEREMARGAWRGPLHGVPIVHKDIILTKGARTTAGSRHLQEFVPDHDATVVSRWRDAGAISLGKANTNEFACGDPGVLAQPANPHDPTMVPGGSSSGSAVALAAGLCWGATGTDTGGSIRGPAAYCGVVGLKPTYGLVSLHGVLPLAHTLDHCGPMARTVGDLPCLLEAMWGPDPADPGTAAAKCGDLTGALGSPDLTGLRIGLPQAPLELPSLDPEMAAAVRTAAGVLERLGAELVECEIPLLDEVIQAGTAILGREAYAVHAERLARQADLYGPMTRKRILEFQRCTAADYEHALAVRQRFISELRGLFTRVDAVLSPAMPGPAFPIADFATRAFQYGPYTRPGNVSGAPCLSLPCGYTGGGLPLGMQLMGRWWEEGLILRIGHAYEQATDWHKRTPQR